MSLIFEFGLALEGGAKALAEGAAKYGRGNWRLGMPQNEILDSIGRHLIALASGEEIDEASGLPHVDKIFTNALMLSQYHHMKKLSTTAQTDAADKPAV
jgi:hypothetical protein